MATTTVQTKSGQSSGSTVTINITTSAGNLLGIVTGSFNTNPSAPSRTGESNNVAVSPFTDVGTDTLRGDYMMNIGGNSNSVVGTGNSGGTACCVTELTGAKTSAALGAVNHAVSTSTTIQAGSITPTAGSAIMAGCNDNGSGTAASTISDSQFTYTVDEVGGAGTVWDEATAVAGSAHTDNVTANATNPTWTTHHSSTTAMCALIMEFLAAAGGNTFNLTVSCTQSQAVALAKTVSLARSITQSQAVALAKTVSLARSITQSQAVALITGFSFNITVSCTQSQAVTLVTNLTKHLTVSCTQSQAVSLALSVIHPVVSGVGTLFLRLRSPHDSDPPSWMGI